MNKLEHYLKKRRLELKLSQLAYAVYKRVELAKGKVFEMSKFKDVSDEWVPINKACQKLLEAVEILKDINN